MRQPEPALIAPGTPEWRATVSASKVPPILGLSPWQSAYSLYREMRGEVEPQAGNAGTSYGHRREPDILRWFADEHPEHEVGPTGTWRHPDNPSWIATPDGTWGEDLVEVKTVKPNVAWKWGDPGTAEVPANYLAQVAWQMICCGAERVWVAADVAMEYRLYVVEWEDIASDVPVILDYVTDFQRRLETGEPPEMDGSDATYRAVRELHPDIQDSEVVLPDHLAYGFVTAVAHDKVHAAERKRYTSLIADYMGNARRAVTTTGDLVATRTTRGGTPYVTAARTIHQLAERKAS